MSRTKTIFISTGILLLSAVITAVVFMTEPDAQRETATKKTAMLVDVVKVERGSARTGAEIPDRTCGEKKGARTALPGRPQNNAASAPMRRP